MEQETNKPPFKAGQIWIFSAPSWFTPLNQPDRLKPNHYYVVEDVNNDGEAKFLGVQGYFKNYFFEFYSQPTEDPKQAIENDFAKTHKKIYEIPTKLIPIKYESNGDDFLWAFIKEELGRDESAKPTKDQSILEEFTHYKKDAEIAHNMMKSLVEKLQSEIKEKDEKIKNLVSIIDNIKEILE